MNRETSVDALHEGDRTGILTTVYEQEKELTKQDKVEITCPCGESGPLKEAFRCFYCEVYFCPNCAEDHFGGWSP